MQNLKTISWWLVVVGAINWGLVGLFDMNIIYNVFEEGTLANIIYVLIGLSGVYLILKRYNLMTKF